MADEVTPKEGRPVFATQLLGRRKIFFEEGLYVEHDLSKKIEDALGVFVLGDDTVDGYCPFCKRTSVFHCGGPDVARIREKKSKAAGMAVMPPHSMGPQPPLIPRQFMLQLVCSRDLAHHQIDFYFDARNNTLRKVGQYPSHADIGIAEVDRFRSVLPDEKLAELKRGIGLNAHGAGIGGFAYVRRVFESLIEEAHQTASPDAGWDEVAYVAGRMSDRIGLLRAHLPEILVTNAAYYNILSKGTHDLEEQECLKYFPAIRSGIECILDSLLEERERKRRAAEFTSAVGKVAGELGQKDEPKGKA